MARLIDANALLRHKRKMSGADFGGEFWDEAVLASDIKNAPTVDAVEVVHGEWISVDERLPENFISVLGYMTDAKEFPPVRECYTVGNAFFFPALGEVHPVSHWCEMPEPPKGE